METLYNNHNGRENVWHIQVVETDDGCMVRTAHGIKDGKMITHETLIDKGKNVGKKNETNAKEQAILEAKKEWDKKIKQGYCVVNGTSTVAFKPMLALEFDKKDIKFPCYIQPKLDGIRCLIFKKETIIFQSRQNKLFEPFIHLLPELELIFAKHPNIILDGELYCHGLGFETVTSMVRRAKVRHPDIEKINYVIYDCINKMKYDDRMKLLSPFMFNKVYFIETIESYNIQHIEDSHTHYTKNGYEGIMIRSNGLYKQGRSKDLLKYKKFLDKEYEVVGHHEGTGTHAGTPIFICKTNVEEIIDKSKIFTFGVTMNGPIDIRKEMLKHVNDYYGKMLTVKYQELSVDGIPRFPIGLAFRDYE